MIESWSSRASRGWWRWSCSWKNTQNPTTAGLLSNSPYSLMILVLFLCEAWRVKRGVLALKLHLYTHTCRGSFRVWTPSLLVWLWKSSCYCVFFSRPLFRHASNIFFKYQPTSPCPPCPGIVQQSLPARPGFIREPPNFIRHFRLTNSTCTWNQPWWHTASSLGQHDVSNHLKSLIIH